MAHKICFYIRKQNFCGSVVVLKRSLYVQTRFRPHFSRLGGIENGKQ